VLQAVIIRTSWHGTRKGTTEPADSAVAHLEEVANVKTKEEYRRETETQIRKSGAEISEILLAYEARKETEFPDWLSLIETECQSIRKTLLEDGNDENRTAKLRVVSDIENRLEVTAHIWQAAVDYMELPSLIRNLKAHLEDKNKVVDALANWCVAQDEIIQELRALELRLAKAAPGKQPALGRGRLAAKVRSQVQTLPS
jgi:hypothetical protein